MEGLPIYQGPRAFGIIYRKTKWQFQFESMSELNRQNVHKSEQDDSVIKNSTMINRLPALASLIWVLLLNELEKYGRDRQTSSRRSPTFNQVAGRAIELTGCYVRAETCKSNSHQSSCINQHPVTNCNRYLLSLYTQATWAQYFPRKKWSSDNYLSFASIIFVAYSSFEILYRFVF